MPIDRKLLQTLRCPVTKRPLRTVKPDVIATINSAIEASTLHYADGRLVKQPLTEALITDNERNIYRVDDGIPVMFEDESIPVSQVDGFERSANSASNPVESLFDSHR